ncbi:MAG: hypothetical protein H6772_00120 [Pseudomonadales bacterium]|nr:hypothetical protein [Pseudomonadales bacterium]
MRHKLINLLLWIFIGLISLGQLQRIELSGIFNGINFYLHDVFILVWLIAFFFNHFSKILGAIKNALKSYSNIINTKYFFEKMFLSTLIVGILINIVKFQDYVSLLYLLRLLNYIGFAISLKYLIKIKSITTTNLRFKFFSFGIMIMSLGLLQIIFINDTRFLSILGWDDHFHRLISTIFDPGFTGIILVISHLYFLTLDTLVKNKSIKFLISFSFLLAISLTFSRATYLALILGLMGIPILNKLISHEKINIVSKEIIMYIFIFIFMLIFIPKPGGEGVNLIRTSTVEARTSIAISQISNLSFQTLLVGNGLFSKQNSLVLKSVQNNNSIIPSHSRIPDNLFINILLSTGIIGVFCAIYLIIKYLTYLIKVDLMLAIAFIVTLFHSQFSNSLLQPFVLLLLLGGIATIKKTIKIKY